MGKALIVTRTRGQTDAVVGPLWTSEMSDWPAAAPSLEDSTGIYVPPGDAPALRSAMSFLLAHPDVAGELGRNGRTRAQSMFSIETFTHNFARAIAGTSVGVPV
jgi:glycosyltransferase involved in cell wall biosynthesis